MMVMMFHNVVIDDDVCVADDYIDDFDDDENGLKSKTF